jgi:hypothetical protein
MSCISFARYRLNCVGLASITTVACASSVCPKQPRATAPTQVAAVSPPTTAHAPCPTVTPAAPPPSREILTAFDCFSSIEIKRAQSLRHWQGGGPEGAAWNIDTMPIQCSVRVDAPCDGTLHLQLFGNAQPFKRQTRSLRQGSTSLEIEVPAKQWVSAAESWGLAYETLVLAIAGVLVCADGPEQHRFADAFVAGFASGE